MVPSVLLVLLLVLLVLVLLVLLVLLLVLLPASGPALQRGRSRWKARPRLWPWSLALRRQQRGCSCYSGRRRTTQRPGAIRSPRTKAC